MDEGSIQFRVGVSIKLIRIDILGKSVAECRPPIVPSVCPEREQHLAEAPRGGGEEAAGRARARDEGECGHLLAQGHRHAPYFFFTTPDPAESGFRIRACEASDR